MSHAARTCSRRAIEQSASFDIPPVSRKLDHSGWLVLTCIYRNQVHSSECGARLLVGYDLEMKHEFIPGAAFGPKMGGFFSRVNPEGSSVSRSIQACVPIWLTERLDPPSRILTLMGNKSFPQHHGMSERTNPFSIALISIGAIRVGWVDDVLEMGTNMFVFHLGTILDFLSPMGAQSGPSL